MTSRSLYLLTVVSLLTTLVSFILNPENPLPSVLIGTICAVGMYLAAMLKEILEALRNLQKTLESQQQDNESAKRDLSF